MDGALTFRESADSFSCMRSMIVRRRSRIAGQDDGRSGAVAPQTERMTRVRASKFGMTPVARDLHGLLARVRGGNRQLEIASGPPHGGEAW